MDSLKWAELFHEQGIADRDKLIEMIVNIRSQMAEFKRDEQANKEKIEMLEHCEENNRREIESLKLNEEASKREIEMLKHGEEASRREIKMLKCGEEDNRREIEMLEHELRLKDGKIEAIMCENKLFKDEIRSIKEEKKDLANQVRILVEKVKQEIVERRQSVELCSEKSINQEEESIPADIHCEESMQAPEGWVDPIDVTHVWDIDDNVLDESWGWGDKSSPYFHGNAFPYKYQLGTLNFHGQFLWIALLINPGERDEALPWPFRGAVTITVADRHRPSPEKCWRITQHCEISKLRRDYEYRCCDSFVFLHSQLEAAGLDLAHGVCVMCVIVPDEDPLDAPAAARPQ